MSTERAKRLTPDPIAIDGLTTDQVVFLDQWLGNDLVVRLSNLPTVDDVQPLHARPPLTQRRAKATELRTALIEVYNLLALARQKEAGLERRVDDLVNARLTLVRENVDLTAQIGQERIDEGHRDRILSTVIMLTGAEIVDIKRYSKGTKLVIEWCDALGITYRFYTGALRRLEISHEKQEHALEFSLNIVPTTGLDKIQWLALRGWLTSFINPTELRDAQPGFIKEHMKAKTDPADGGKENFLGFLGRVLGFDVPDDVIDKLEKNGNATFAYHTKTPGKFDLSAGFRDKLFPEKESESRHCVFCGRYH